MIGAGFLHLPPVRHAFPILKNRLLPQNSGKFKKTGFSGQALAAGVKDQPSILCNAPEIRLSFSSG